MKKVLSVLLALLLPTLAWAESAEPAAERIETLAKALVAAPDDGARERLLAAAPPEQARDEGLRRQFHTLTKALIDNGEYERARGLLSFARQWCEQSADRKGVVLSEMGEGNIHAYQGHNREALAKFELAQRFFAQSSDTRMEARVAHNKAFIESRLGDYREALADAKHALEIDQPTHDKEDLIGDLQGLGNVYFVQGRFEQANVYYTQAIVLAEGDDGWLDYLYYSQGECLSALGDLPGAIASAGKALASAQKIKDQPREASALTALAGYQAQLDHSAEAAELYRQAFSMAEALGETERQAVALLGLGDVAARQANSPDALREALSIAERVSDLARRTGDLYDIWRARTLTGRLLRRAGRHPEARTALEEAITAIEDSRGRLTGGDVEATAYFGDKLAPYQEMVALLVDQRRFDEALSFAEQAKARVLVETLRGPKTNYEEMLTAVEREALKKSGEQIADLNRERTNTPAAKRGAVEERLRQARLAREEAEETALTAHPELRRQVPPREASASRLTPAELGTLLGPPERHAALLEYVVGQAETFAFVVRRSSAPAAEPTVQAFRLPLGGAALARRVEHYRRTLADQGPGWAREARALGDDMLGAVRQALADAGRIVVIPDGALWELPFQTLPVAAGPPATRAEDTLDARPLCLAPSLRFLLQTRAVGGESRRSLEGLRLLAFGNPETRPAVETASSDEPPPCDGEFAPLPDAEQEVRALETLYGSARSRVYVGREAREAVFRREAERDWDVVHFATHGVCDDRAPLYSRLLLSQRDLEPGEDGFLEAWELMRQPLHARLAVLSACETARGRIGAGEGLIGLSWALFTAGCPSCVVSQWKVDSASNTALMVEFHRQLRAGAGRAEALRRAALALAADPKTAHPFYWAPFVLVGEGD